jgi:4a-hydroxytetrahydrobiopterin dehydratase
MLWRRHELRNLMTHYTAASIAEALGTDAADWQWDAGCIKTELEFKDFKTAFAFMSKVADMAEKLGHHPDWQNSYNRIGISLRTHDQNAVTALDVALAKHISMLYSSHS